MKFLICHGYLSSITEIIHYIANKIYIWEVCRTRGNSCQRYYVSNYTSLISGLEKVFLIKLFVLIHSYGPFKPSKSIFHFNPPILYLNISYTFLGVKTAIPLLYRFKRWRVFVEKYKMNLTFYYHSVKI